MSGISGGRSSAHNYLQWGTETDFNVFSTMTKQFGFETKLTGVQPNQNLLTLQGQNSNTIQKYGFGDFEGSYSLEWVFSNPWFLEMLYGDVLGTGTAAPFTYTFENTELKKTFSLEDGFEAATENIVRRLSGCILNSTTISSRLNQFVKVRSDCLYASEPNPPTITLDPSIPVDDVDFPYTAEFATLQLPDGTTIVELQDFDLVINPNGAYNRGHNNKTPTSAWWGLMSFEGRLNATVKDADLLKSVLDRVEVADMKIVLTNKLSAENEKSVTFTGTGVGLGMHSVDFSPNELVIENVPFTIRELDAVAINPISTVP